MLLVLLVRRVMLWIVEVISVRLEVVGSIAVRIVGSR